MCVGGGGPGPVEAGVFNQGVAFGHYGTCEGYGVVELSGNFWGYDGRVGTRGEGGVVLEARVYGLSYVIGDPPCAIGGEVVVGVVESEAEEYAAVVALALHVGDDVAEGVYDDVSMAVGGRDDLGGLDYVWVRAYDVVYAVGYEPLGEGFLGGVGCEDVFYAPVYAGDDEVWFEGLRFEDVGCDYGGVDIVDNVA